MATKGNPEKQDADFMIDEVLKSVAQGELTPEKARGVLNHNFRIFLTPEEIEVAPLCEACGEVVVSPLNAVIRRDGVYHKECAPEEGSDLKPDHCLFTDEAYTSVVLCGEDCDLMCYKHHDQIALVEGK